MEHGRKKSAPEVRRRCAVRMSASIPVSSFRNSIIRMKWSDGCWVILLNSRDTHAKWGKTCLNKTWTAVYDLKIAKPGTKYGCRSQNSEGWSLSRVLQRPCSIESALHGLLHDAHVTNPQARQKNLMKRGWIRHTLTNRSAWYSSQTEIKPIALVWLRSSRIRNEVEGELCVCFSITKQSSADTRFWELTWHTKFYWEIGLVFMITFTRYFVPTKFLSDVNHGKGDTTTSYLFFPIPRLTASSRIIFAQPNSSSGSNPTRKLSHLLGGSSILFMTAYLQWLNMVNILWIKPKRSTF